MAATAQIESDAIRTLGWDRNTPLSAAQLTECALGGRNGCDAAYAINGYEYADAEGITTDASYRYDDVYYGACDPNNCQSLTCRASSYENVLKVASYGGMFTEQDMAAYVQSTGPVVASVDSTYWQDYKGGVMTSCVWFYAEVNHEVQFVGVDTAANPPYWKVRNSWGTTWGEGGFMRMQYGANKCGLLAGSGEFASYTRVQYSPQLC